MNVEEKRILKSFIVPLIFCLILWIIKFYEISTGISFVEYGVYPRTWEGVPGIFLTPFIHGDYQHLFSNTIPLIILGACLIYFYRDIALKTIILMWLLNGIWIWIGARSAWHIGASGIVYGLAAFIFLSGVLRWEKRMMALSLMVIFLYGGMIWGIFPIFYKSSWEAHLFGLIAGGFLAVVYRKEGPQRIPFEWENESEDDANEIDSAIAEQTPTNEDTLNVTYTYKLNEETDESQKKD